MKARKSLNVFVGLLFCTTVFAVGGRQGAISGVPPDGGALTKISLFCSFDGNEPPADNEVYKKVVDYTKVELDPIWSPAASYSERLNTFLASGALPTILWIGEAKSPNILSAINGGAFWELTPYIPQYYQLNRINPDIYRNISLQGKTWFIPRTRPVVKDGIIYRKDWLNKLGLSEPKTLEELYNVLRAFTEDDPDGNGLDDTYGLADIKSLNRFRYLVCAIGGPNEYAVIDRKMTIDHLQPEYATVLKFYRNLYAKGYMNKDFPLIELAGMHEKVNKNEAGMVFTDPEQITRYEELKKNVPTAEFATFAALDAGRSRLSIGSNGGFAITKTGAKTEKDMLRALRFLEDLSSDEIQNLLVWGFEGIHYTLENGKAKRTSDQLVQYQKEVFRWERAMRMRDIDDAIPGVLNAELTAYHNLIKKMTDKLVPNPAITLISPTRSTEGPKLDRIINDARTKYIMGEINDAGWEAAVSKWRTSGGDKILEEFTALYKP
jgi:putative aldouronate transport system substrate-binding protein